MQLLYTSDLKSTTEKTMLTEQQQQEVLEYVARVGTAFAVAIYRSRSRELLKKANDVIDVRDRLCGALESHLDAQFDSHPNDETILYGAFNSYSDSFFRQHKLYETLENEAIRLDLPGAEPGRQEHLDGNGIRISLADIQQELASPGMY